MTHMAKRVRVIPRRAVLRGAGGMALALPWLEAMLPKQASAQAAAAIPPRALFIYFPTGYKNGGWIPNTAAGVYPDVTIPAIATALTPHKANLNFITGTGNAPAAVGSGGDGIHARATGTFLLYETLLKTGFEKTGVSADQLIARAVGTGTCVPSLVTGIPGERLPGFDEDGYGEVYLDNISFTGPRANVQKDSNPQTLFRRLIQCASLKPGTGMPTTTTGGMPMPDPVAAERTKFEQSVMSAVKAEAKRLSGCVGMEDRARLDQYFTSITELEQRFATTPPVTTGGGPGPISMGCVQPAEPAAAGANYQASIHLMMDVIIFAFRCGLTRVASMMMDGAFSRRNYGLPAVTSDYIHGLSHGEIGGKSVDHPRWVAITTHFFENFAYLLQQMSSINEGAGTLLDNSIVYISSEFGDGDAHNQQELPTIVAGKGSGKFKTGQRIALASRTSGANVVLTIMQAMGVTQTTLGDSTGTVSSLLA